MSPADETDTADSDGPSSVYCPECRTEASTDWTFYRSCEASLGDAETTDGRLVVRNDGESVDLSELVEGETGGPKYGYTEFYEGRRPNEAVDPFIG